MKDISRRITIAWLSLGSRFLPFADLATSDLPLSRLLRLSLFQVSVGMALVLLVGTLNRVMIVELGVPASLVAIMVALPVLFAPFRTLVGYSSDTHRCELGWRRIPFVWQGTMLQFGGFAVMPFAILVLAGQGESGWLPGIVGQVSAAIAFLLAGAGAHIVQTVGLALATDLTAQESHPKVVGLMYVMLLLGMLVSALLFGVALANFTPGRLVQVVQSAALLTLILNAIAFWKQEPRNPPRGRVLPPPDPGFRESWAMFCAGDHAIRRLVIVGLGAMAFGMSDVLLEPFGGQVLGLSVAATTKLTALLALGGLLGFAYGSHALDADGDAYRIAQHGAWIGLPAFVLVIVSAPWEMTGLFLAGNLLVGFGGALFGHGTLTATMNRAPRKQAGLAIGAWGAVQATAVGVGIALSGIIRDIVDTVLGSAEQVWAFSGIATGYITVYLIEIVLLVVVIVVAMPLFRSASDTGYAEASTAEPSK